MSSVIDVSDKIRSSMVKIMSSVMGTLLTVDKIIKLLREKKVLKVSCLKKKSEGGISNKYIMHQEVT